MVISTIIVNMESLSRGRDGLNPYAFANKAKSYHLSGFTARSTKTSLIASPDFRIFPLAGPIQKKTANDFNFKRIFCNNNKIHIMDGNTRRKTGEESVAYNKRSAVLIAGRLPLIC